MNNRNKFAKTTILSALILLLFTTCKKFPEDTFAFRTVKARIEAEWKIEKILINGTDATNSYNDSLAPLSINNFHFWFVYNKLAPNPNKDDTKDLFLINKSSKSYKDAYNHNDVAIGHFDYEENKKYLIAWLDKNQTKDTVYAKIFKNLFERYNYQSRYLIKSLYHKTFIIEGVKNNNIYKVYFTRTQR